MKAGLCARRCPHCRSRIAALDPESWYRDHLERRVAGVAAAVAHALALPVTLVRVGFVALTFLHFVGPILYLALWFLVPFTPGGPRLLDTVLEWAGSLGGRHPGPRVPPSGPPNGADATHFDLVSGGPRA